MTDESTTSNVETLFAGKFKNAEELENGYKNLESFTNKRQSELLNEKNELAKKLSEVSSVPEEYVVPADITLDENEKNEIKELAKKTDLPQNSFEKLIKEAASRKQAEINHTQQLRQQIGEEKINHMAEFLNKKYTPEVANMVLQNALKNVNQFNQLETERQASLNSSVPGIDKTGATPSSSTFDQRKEAFRLTQKYPNDEKHQLNYINMLKNKN